jgi:flagellar basal-body rod protein FlgG
MGLHISASGIANAIRRNDITANNIANLRTPGFQSSRADNVDSAGGGVTIGGVSRDTASGGLQVTGRDLDVATSDGFFRVRQPNGDVAFTRDGSFGLNADGEVVTSDGARLDPPVRVPANATSVTVGRDGTVFATVPGELQPQRAGQIEVFEFANASGLEAIGGNLFVPTAASGEGQVLAASGGVIPGAIAQSNVNVAEQAVNTILDTNALRANVNAFRAQDEMLGELLNIRS